jgi:hypothetical protein
MNIPKWCKLFEFHGGGQLLVRFARDVLAVEYACVLYLESIDPSGRAWFLADAFEDEASARKAFDGFGAAEAEAVMTYLHRQRTSVIPPDTRYLLDEAPAIALLYDMAAEQGFLLDDAEVRGAEIAEGAPFAVAFARAGEDYAVWDVPLPVSMAAHAYDGWALQMEMQKLAFELEGVEGEEAAGEEEEEEGFI